MPSLPAGGHRFDLASAPRVRSAGRSRPMSMSRPFHGVIPAMAIPFRDDYKIDEEGGSRAAAG